MSESRSLPDPEPTDRVFLRALSLTDFRNYPSLSVEFGGGLVALVGENGVGKTNLLEAISLLTPGRGLRRAAYEEASRAGADGGWVVSASVERNGEAARIGSGLTELSQGPGRGRIVRINGASAASADALLDYLRLLWLTPAMDGLFTGPASERRRFLDRLVLTVDAEHGRRTREFDRLLTQRNRLLEDNAPPGWLDAVEAELASRAVAIGVARSETAQLLSAAMRRHEEDASAFPAGLIALIGDFDREIEGASASAAELQYRALLAEGRTADRAAGRTLNGPHRSDLDVLFAAKQMPAALSSTGEQKALLIGLILAHAELVGGISGMRPILLLDEVAAHLDAGRRAALFRRLAALGSQTFMTGTDASLFEAARAGGELFLIRSQRAERMSFGSAA